MCVRREVGVQDVTATDVRSAAPPTGAELYQPLVSLLTISREAEPDYD